MKCRAKLFHACHHFLFRERRVRVIKSDFKQQYNLIRLQNGLNGDTDFI